MDSAATVSRAITSKPRDALSYNTMIIIIIIIPDIK